MKQDALDDRAFDTLFRKARTHNGWNGEDVPESKLNELYELFKWGPTSANTTPGRVIFVKSKAAKEKLNPLMDKGNAEKTMAAPVTAIVAYDLKFYKHLDRLFPSGAEKMTTMYEGAPEKAKKAAVQGGTLQGAYLILAARALGLDCGPMNGFNAQGIKDAFFPGEDVEVNFLCNLGHGDVSKLYPRGQRLSFDEACKIL